MSNRGFDDLDTCVEYYRGNCSLAVSFNIRASSTQRDGVDAYKGIFSSSESKTLNYVQRLQSYLIYLTDTILLPLPVNALTGDTSPTLSSIPVNLESSSADSISAVPGRCTNCSE